MTDINLKITIPKDSESRPFIRAMLRVIGFAKMLLKKIEQGESVD